MHGPSGRRQRGCCCRVASPPLPSWPGLLLYCKLLQLAPLHIAAIGYMLGSTSASRQQQRKSQSAAMPPWAAMPAWAPPEVQRFSRAAAGAWLQLHKAFQSVRGGVLLGLLPPLTALRPARPLAGGGAPPSAPAWDG